MKKVTHAKFVEELKRLAVWPHGRNRRRAVIRLYERYIAAMKADLTTAPLHVYDRLERAVKLSEQLLSAMKRDDLPEINRTDAIMKAGGGVNLLNPNA